MKQTLIRLAFVSSVLLLIYVVMKGCFHTVLPLLIGFALAVAVQKPAKRLAGRFGCGTGKIATILVLAVYVIVGGCVVWLAQRASARLVTVYDAMPQIFEKAAASFETIRQRVLQPFRKNGVEVVSTQQATAWLSRLAQPLLETVSAGIGKVASGIPGTLFNLLITVIAGCYTAADYPAIAAFFKEALPESYQTTLRKIGRIAGQTVGTFIKGYGLLSLIGFGEMALYFTVIGQPGGLLTAAVIALVDVLPVLGSGLVIVPWALVSFLSGRYWFGLGLVALFVVMTVVRNALEPKLVAGKAGLHPLLALLTLVVGLRLFGPVGMVVLPFASAVALRYLTDEFLLKNQNT